MAAGVNINRASTNRKHLYVVAGRLTNIYCLQHRVEGFHFSAFIECTTITYENPNSADTTRQGLYTGIKDLSEQASICLISGQLSLHSYIGSSDSSL